MTLTTLRPRHALHAVELSMLKRLLANLLLLVFGFAVSAFILEVSVRSFFPEKIMPRFVHDPGYGVRDNQPNIVTSLFVPEQYRVSVSTNNVGLRGRADYSQSKPDGVYRIAMLGDSFLFGHGVNDNDVVSAVLERSLNTRFAHPRSEVLNFGVSGFGSSEELVAYGAKVRRYSPDMTIIFYFDNDIGNTAVSRLFALDEAGILRRSNEAYLPGVKAREIMYAIPPVRWLFEHSQAWNLIRNRLSGIVQGRLLAEQGLSSFDDQKPGAVALTRAVLRQLLTEIKTDGAVPAVFIIPQEGHSNFPLAVNTLSKEGVMVFDGRAFFDESDYYSVDRHWNKKGHEKAARVIEHGITRLLHSDRFVERIQH